MSVHYRRVKIPGVFTTGEFRIPVMQHCPGTRVSDPDPHGSALHLSPGSGSAFQMRIRIQLFIKLAPKAQIIHIIQSYLTNFNIFFFFFKFQSSNIKKAYLQSLYKYLYKYLFYFVKARIWVRDPDPHLVFRQDPDPQKTDADPKHCLILKFIFFFNELIIRIAPFNYTVTYIMQ